MRCAKPPFWRWFLTLLLMRIIQLMHQQGSDGLASSSALLDSTAVLSIGLTVSIGHKLRSL